jgi:hypothetical protein
MVKASLARDTARTGRQMDLVFEGASRAAGPDWTRVEVGKLDEQSQVRLANQLLRQQIQEWWQRQGNTDNPSDAYLFPERGTLHLNGPVEGGTPLLQILVPRANGHRTGWGWVVGSGRVLR